MAAPAIFVAILDLAQPLPDLSSKGPSGVNYSVALILVRLHGQPIAMIELPFDGAPISGQAISDAAWHAEPEKITEHLRGDGMEGTIGSTMPIPSSLAEEWSKLPCWKNDGELPKVTVAIATKDRAAELERCLPTLLAMDYPDFEILVVENGGVVETTRQMVERLAANDDRLRYIGLDEKGASLARNVALHEARGSIIAYTDDDVIADRFWLRGLVRPFLADAEVECVTGLIVPGELDTEAQIWFEQYDGFGRGLKPLTYTLESRGEGIPVLYPYSIGIVGSGNNSAFRVDSMRHTGGWDVHLGPGVPAKAGEDLDVFIKVIMTGGKIAFEPSAVISHFHRRGYEGFEKQMMQYGVGVGALFAKWIPMRPVLSLKLLLRLPRALQVIHKQHTTSNLDDRAVKFPKRLSRRQNLGMVIGPFLFVRSIWVAKRNPALAKDEHGVVMVKGRLSRERL